MERDFAKVLRAKNGQQVLVRVLDDDEGVRLAFSARLDGVTMDMSIKFGDDQVDKAFAAMDATEDRAADATIAQLAHFLEGGEDA